MAVGQALPRQRRIFGQGIRKAYHVQSSKEGGKDLNLNGSTPSSVSLPPAPSSDPQSHDPDVSKKSLDELKRRLRTQKTQPHGPRPSRTEPRRETNSRSPWLSGKLLQRPDRYFSFQEDVDASLLDIDYVSLFPKALEEGDENLATRCLLAAAGNGNAIFISEIHNDTFTSVMELMLPSKATIELLDLHQDVSLRMIIHLSITRAELICKLRCRLIDWICDLRKQSGCRLTFDQCKLALRGAAMLDDKEYGHKAWKRLLEEGHRPDTQCWNDYMSCTVWMRMYEWETRRRLRVMPYHMKMRQSNAAPPKYQKFRVGDGGVREEATTILNDMLAQGTSTNEETWTIYMTAVAREGDVAGVASTLMRIWGISVDAMMQAKPSEDPRAFAKMDRNDERYPTSRLLFTIAHCFGINNEVPLAIRLVRYVSQIYEISITAEVWDQLLEWTSVLSFYRKIDSGNYAGQNVGRLSPQTYESLFESIRGEPSNFIPTMKTYDQLMKNLSIRHKVPTMYMRMKEAQELVVNAHESYKNAWRLLKEEADRPTSSPVKIESLRTDFEKHYTISHKNNYLFKKWIQYLLGTTPHRSRTDARLSYKSKVGEILDPNTLPPVGINPENIDAPPRSFTLDTLPQILYHWRAFAPSTIVYEVPGGLLEFNFREQSVINKNAKRQMRWMEDEGRVLDKLQSVSPRLLFQRIGTTMKPLTKNMNRILDEREQREGNSSEFE